MKKVIKFKPKGMNRDLSKANFSPEFSYENRNIRFVTNESNSLLSIVNEKGTKQVDIDSSNFTGVPVGQASFIDNLILFFCDSNAENPTDYIYRVWVEEEDVKIEQLYEGNLNFDVKHPIETLPSVENDIYKVYWTDGINQPHILTMKHSEEGNKLSEVHVSSFSPDISTNAKIEVTKSFNGGLFAPGIIQYLCTQYNKRSSESNVCAITPLNYITYDSERGASAEEKSNITFDLKITGLSEEYDYTRIYSIQRTSLDATPVCKRVIDLPTPTETTTFVVEDKGNFTDEGIVFNNLGDVEEVLIVNVDNVDVDNSNAVYNIYLEDSQGNSYRLSEVDNFAYGEGVTISYKGVDISYEENKGFVYPIVKVKWPDHEINLFEGCTLTIKTKVISTEEIDSSTSKVTIGLKQIIGYSTLEFPIHKYNVYEKAILFSDDGTYGDNIDPTELLYLGGEIITAGTLNEKDGTLFLGDISIQNKKTDSLNSYIESNKAGLKIDYNPKEIKYYPDKMGYYSYKNSLQYPSNEVLSLKKGEAYRFGIQCQNKAGKWLDPIHIKDDIVKYTFENGEKELIKAEVTFNGIKDYLVNDEIIAIRPVIVYPEFHKRRCVCQGMVCPTVYNVRDRYTNSPYAQASWVARPSLATKINDEVIYTFEGQNVGDNYLSSNKYTIALLPTDKTGVYKVINFIMHDIEDLTLTITKDDNGKETLQFSTDTFWGKVNYRGRVLRSRITLPTTVLTFKEEENENEGTTDEVTDRVTIDIGLIQGKGGGSVENIDNWRNWYIRKSAEFSSFYKSGLSIYENRHNYPILGSGNLNGEIQSLYECPETPYLNTSESTKQNAWVQENQEYFFVDKSIFTLNSPDIEFEDNIVLENLSNCKFRIIGTISIDANYSDVKIETSTPPMNITSSRIGRGFYKEDSSISLENTNVYAMGGIAAGPYWADGAAYDGERPQEEFLHLVYLWHRNGPLNNNTKKLDGEERPAMLKTKRTAISRYSYKTNYFKEYYTPTAGISDAKIFNNNEVGLLKLKAPERSTFTEIYYYGNVDKIVNTSIFNYTNNGLEYNKTLSLKGEVLRDKSQGYKMFYAGAQIPDNDEPREKESLSYSYKGAVQHFIGKYYNEGWDPVSMQYKSTPHAVIALQSLFTESTDASINKSTVILPTIVDNESIDKEPNEDEQVTAFWENNPGTHIRQKTLSTDTMGYTPTNGYLFLGELYRDLTVEEVFGPTHRDSMIKDSWVPCGDKVVIDSTSPNDITVEWTEGDTYYQRYDCLKTYAFTPESQNQVVDIISFMCDTRVNIDGRYDKNRGQQNNFVMSPTNFNLYNSVYSQRNNFFNYRIIEDKDSVFKYPSTITWTKTKTLGEDVDPWTNITLASTIDLEGKQGNVTSIQKLNNQLLAFQEKGINLIQYNENTQIATTEGTPIEIANSGKVTGARIISNNIGCINKWSICNAPSGIYFADSINKNIMHYGESLNNLSSTLGFKSWAHDNITSKIWNPVDFNNIVTYYDPVNKDILFINDKECLAYSEVLSQFSSFYNYEKTPFIGNIKGTTLLLHKDNSEEKNYYMWELNKGDYNSFFNSKKPFSIEVIANDNPTVDKIFSNIEFTSDTWNNNTLTGNTFDTLTVHNEYQQGSINLSFIKNKPSPLKRKFRIWRADIPRDSSNNRDRMRNTWLNLKLEKSNADNNSDKTVLHDLSVYYYI